MKNKGIFSKFTKIITNSNGKIMNANASKKTIIKNIAIFAGSATICVGGIILCKNTVCKGNIDELVSSDDLDNNTSDITLDGIDIDSSDINSNDFTSSDMAESDLNSELDINSEEISYGITTSSEGISVEGAEIVSKGMTAEDIIVKSKEAAKQFNKEAVLEHQNYRFGELKPSDLYSVVYLANIHNVSCEETNRLIDGEFISDDIKKNIENSFNFYELYTDDTVNKIMEGKTNLIDLSILLTDEKGIKTFKTMNKIMIDSINNTNEENYKNYVDTSLYFASNIDNNTRDSIYEIRREDLTLGSNYTLGFVANTINMISYNNGVYDEEISEMLQNGANDFSKVADLFSNYKVDCAGRQYTKR